MKLTEAVLYRWRGAAVEKPELRLAIYPDEWRELCDLALKGLGTPVPEVAGSEVDALRRGQALAVVPLVGNVLEHWDSLPNDLKDHIREIDDGLWSKPSMRCRTRWRTTSRQ